MPTITVNEVNVEMKAENGAVITERLQPAEEISGNSLDLWFLGDLMSKQPKGGFKMTLRDSNNALSYQYVEAGKLGEARPSLFRYSGRIVLQAAAVTAAETENLEGPLSKMGVKVDKNIAAAEFSTGSIEMEFSGAVDDGSRTRMSAALGVQIGSIKLDDRNYGVMSVKIDFSMTA